MVQSLVQILDHSGIGSINGLDSTVLIQSIHHTVTGFVACIQRVTTCEATGTEEGVTASKFRQKVGVALCL